MLKRLEEDKNAKKFDIVITFGDCPQCYSDLKKQQWPKKLTACYTALFDKLEEIDSLERLIRENFMPPPEVSYYADRTERQRKTNDAYDRRDVLLSEAAPLKEEFCTRHRLLSF